MDKIKIVFAGTPVFSSDFLLSLLNDDRFLVKAVVTNPDKPVGRKQTITASPVKEMAEDYNIKLFQPNKLAEIKTELAEIKADFLVVIAYGKIIPQSILDLFQYQINVHGSLLPKYRGASPIQSALLNGEKETGVSIMKMLAKMDAGPVYRMHKLKIMPDDSSLSIFQKMSKFSELFPQDLFDIFNGLIPEEQNDDLATYCSKIDKSNSEIQFESMTAVEIKNMLRAYTPWPGIFFIYNDKRVKIVSGNIHDTKGIKCKEGFFLPERVIEEGRKEEDYETWKKRWGI